MPICSRKGNNWWDGGVDKHPCVKIGNGVTLELDEMWFTSDDNNFFRLLVWGVFWSILQKFLYFLVVGFWNINWWALDMQCNFTSYAFAGSSLASTQVVIKSIFDFFWKPITPFSKIFLCYVLSFYFFRWINYASKDTNWACYWTCWLVASCVPHLCS